MLKCIVTILLIIPCILDIGFLANAQEVTPQTDSFFLARKKGILGKIAKSITLKGEYVEPEKTVNRYKKYQGKMIRSITIVPVGFNYNLNDTTPLRTNVAIKIADALHKNTYKSVIRKNLFFKEGQPFYPLVIADNERFLREQTFLRDALILASSSVYSDDSVDVIVLTRDVFSIGASLSISNLDRGKTEIKEENLGGRGHRIAFFGLYDKNRNPVDGYGAELVLRNIRGSFINWTNGFKTFSPAFNSGRREEINFYSSVEKPMASRYTAVTGAASFSYHYTINGYINDSLYINEYSYRYVNTDIWGGYNFGHNKGKTKDSEKRLRHLVALRGFYFNFLDVPAKYQTIYNFRYADINGALASYSLYRQNFYKTNFIYGFGRNEDVPEGLNASIVSGYTNKQGIKRAYYGVEFDASKFNKKEGLFSYTFKSGGYLNKKDFQDVDILLGVSHFTKLLKLNSFWYNRNFMSLSYTRQINPVLNEPLYILSDFGLPFFRTYLIEGRVRSTVKFESVFYNLKRVFGFRIAPFVFSDLSMIQPINKPTNHTAGYPALGGGFRTRNENLTFGTIELRGYYFPRVPDGMKNWKVEVKTKLQFKYNSSFIHRPEFVKPN